MKTIAKVCVFCGSGKGTNELIPKEAYLLGSTLAKKQFTIIYGGAKIGLMGVVAQSSLDNGGEVIGIIPEFLKTKEVVHTSLTTLITTKDMHERKMKMQQMSDAFIILPGGFGTLEEFFEVLTWQQLKLHNKPIGVVNVSGFYDLLLEQLDKMVAAKFLAPEILNSLVVETTATKLIHKMLKR